MFRFQRQRDGAVLGAADGAGGRFAEDEFPARHGPPRDNECNGRNHDVLQSIRCRDEANLLIVRMPCQSSRTARPKERSRLRGSRCIAAPSAKTPILSVVKSQFLGGRHCPNWAENEET